MQTGKGDETFVYYGYHNIFVQLVFAGVVPSEIEQDFLTGKNNLYSARAARYTYYLQSHYQDEGMTRGWKFDYHIHLQNEIARWNEEQSKYINVIASSEWIFERAFLAELFGDFGLVAAAILLIFVYANIVLGSCSPIFMRS